MLMRYKGRMGMRKPWQIENMDEGAYKERIRVFMEARDSLFELITLSPQIFVDECLVNLQGAVLQISYPASGCIQVIGRTVLIHAQMNGACSRT